MKTIIISSYRNVSIRYLLYGSILDELISSDLKVVILVNNENIEYYKNKFKHKNIQIESIYFFKNLKLLRSIIGSIFNTYRLCTSPQENKIDKNETVDLFKKQYKQEWSQNIFRKIAFSFILLMSNLSSVYPFFRKMMMKIESNIFKGKEYDHLFEKYNPSLLIVSSVGHMLDLYIMNASRRNKTKIMTIFHNWDGPTTKGYKANIIDYAIVWNKTMQEETVKYQDIPKDKVFIGGASNYDVYHSKDRYFINRNSFIDHFKLDPDKKIILYAPGGIGLWPKGLEPLHEILKNIQNKNYSLDAQVLLRVHPNFIGKIPEKSSVVLKKDINNEINSLLEKYGDILKISIPICEKLNYDYDLPVEDLKSLSDILLFSDLIITQYSTLLIEASLSDLPTINNCMGNYRDFEDGASIYEKSSHIKNIQQYNAYDSAYNMESMNKAIIKYLLDKRTKEKERRLLTNKILGNTFGSNGINVGKHIAKVVEYISLKD